MFPKGKFDDQVDSTSQALGFIGTPEPGDLWMEYYRAEALQCYGLKLEDLTVTFDYTDRSAEFTLGSGRAVRREEDGFYHVTPGEWETVRCMPGVSRLDDI